MRSNRISFEELLKLNRRESNFSKVMDNTPEEMDSSFKQETAEFYETFVKPTVRKSYLKLIESN